MEVVWISASVGGWMTVFDASMTGGRVDREGKVQAARLSVLATNLEEKW